MSVPGHTNPSAAIRVASPEEAAGVIQMPTGRITDDAFNDWLDGKLREMFYASASEKLPQDMQDIIDRMKAGADDN